MKALCTYKNLDRKALPIWITLHLISTNPHHRVENMTFKMRYCTSIFKWLTHSSATHSSLAKRQGSEHCLPANQLFGQSLMMTYFRTEFQLAQPDCITSCILVKPL